MTQQSRHVLVGCLVLLSLCCARVAAEVFVYEGDQMPVEAGFVVGQNYCDPTEWGEAGCFNQFVSICDETDPPTGESSSYKRSLGDFVLSPAFFVEWKAETDGTSDQLPFGAPCAFAAGPGGGSVRYTFTFARDQAKLNRDNELPIEFATFSPGVPHVHRLDLDNSGTPWFRWYVDRELIAEGEAEGAFPSGMDPAITLLARYFSSSSTTQWHYIRWGVPSQTKGDFDDNGQIDAFDEFYFAECMIGSFQPALPGCAWADFNEDGLVDCTDRDAFRAAWTGAGDPPDLPDCFGEPAAIPAASNWSVTIMALLSLITGTLVFRARKLVTEAQRAQTS